MYFPKEEMDSNPKTPKNTIVILGKGTVGKTSLIFRYINNHCPKRHDPTVEDAYNVQIQLPNSDTKEFSILDTAGEEDYQNMFDQWISVAKGFILVYAIDDQESFDAIKVKIKRIEKHKVNDLPVVLVGNKCDLADRRKISEQQGKDLAKSIGGKYYETSALTDLNGNVKTVFVECAKMIMNNIDGDVHGKVKCCMIF